MKITRLFHDNQYKLNERPSPQAWRRLERRLDEHRRQHKSALYRYLGAAAAVVALLAVISLLGIAVDQKSTSAAASTNRTAQLEELLLADADMDAFRSVELSRQYRDYWPNMATEGNYNKRLTSNNLNHINSNIEVSIQDFKWLEGEWRHETADAESVETWKRRSAKLIEGTATLQADGKIVFTEQMRILQSEGRLFFEIALAKGQAPVRYVLKQYFADRIIFENRALNFPQQIVLDRHSPNMYSFILQNPEPFGMNSAQINHLGRRNVINHQYIIRVMERAAAF